VHLGFSLASKGKSRQSPNYIGCHEPTRSGGRYGRVAHVPVDSRATSPTALAVGAEFLSSLRILPERMGMTTLTGVVIGPFPWARGGFVEENEILRLPASPAGGRSG